MSIINIFFIKYINNLIDFLYKLEIYKLEQYYFVIVKAIFIASLFAYFLCNSVLLKDAFIIFKYSVKDSCLFIKACLTKIDLPEKSNYYTNYIWNKQTYNRIIFKHITLIYVLLIFLLFTIYLSVNEDLGLDIYFLYLSKWLYLFIIIVLLILLFLLNSNRISRSNDITPILWTYFLFYSFMASQERAIFWHSYASAFWFFNIPLIIFSLIINCFIMHLNLFIGLTITDFTFIDIYILENLISWLNFSDVYINKPSLYKKYFSITTFFSNLHILTNNTGYFASFMSASLGSHGASLLENANLSDILGSSGGTGGSSGGNPGGGPGKNK